VTNLGIFRGLWRRNLQWRALGDLRRWPLVRDRIHRVLCRARDFDRL